MQRVPEGADGGGGGRSKRPRIDGDDGGSSRAMEDYQSFTAQLTDIVLKGQSLAGSARMCGPGAFASSLRGPHREAGGHRATPLEMRWALGCDSNAYLRMDVMPLQAAVGEWGASFMADSGFEGGNSAYLASAATPAVAIGNMFPAIARANRVGGLHAWKAHEEAMQREHGRVAASIAPLVTWLCTIPEVRRAVELCLGACNEGVDDDGHMLRTIDALLQLLEDPLRAVKAQYAHTVRNATSQIDSETRLLQQVAQGTGLGLRAQTEKVDSGAFYDHHRSNSNASALVVRGSKAGSGERHSEAPVGMLAFAAASAAAAAGTFGAALGAQSGNHVHRRINDPMAGVGSAQSVGEASKAASEMRSMPGTYWGEAHPGRESGPAWGPMLPDGGPRMVGDAEIFPVDVVNEIKAEVFGTMGIPLLPVSVDGLSGRTLSVLQGFAFGTRDPAFTSFCKVFLEANTPASRGRVENLVFLAKARYDRELRDSTVGMAFLVDNGLKDALSPAKGAAEGDALVPEAFHNSNSYYTKEVFAKLRLGELDESNGEVAAARRVLEDVELWDVTDGESRSTLKTTALRQLFVEIDQILKNSKAYTDYTPKQAAEQISIAAANVARVLSGAASMPELKLIEFGKAIVKVLYGSEGADGELLNALKRVKIGTLVNDGDVPVYNFDPSGLDYDNPYDRLVLIDLIGWDEQSNPLGRANLVFTEIREEQAAARKASAAGPQDRGSGVRVGVLAAGLVAVAAALKGVSKEIVKSADEESAKALKEGEPSATVTPDQPTTPPSSREPLVRHVVEMGAGAAYEQTVGPGLVADQLTFAVNSDDWSRALEQAASTLRFVPTTALSGDTGGWARTDKINAVLGAREDNASSAYCLARGLCATRLPHHHHHQDARAGDRGGEARTQPHLDYSTPSARLDTDVIRVMGAINLATKPAAVSAAVLEPAAPPRDDLVDDFVDLQRFTYEQGGGGGGKRLMSEQERNDLGFADPVAFALWGPPPQSTQTPATRDAFELASLVCATEHLVEYYKTRAVELRQEEEVVEVATQRLAATKLFQLKYLAQMALSRNALADAVAVGGPDQRVLTTRPALPGTDPDSPSRVLYPCDAGLAVWTRAVAGDPKGGGKDELSQRAEIKEVIKRVHAAADDAFFDVFSSTKTEEDKAEWGAFGEQWIGGVEWVVKETFKETAEKGETSASGAAAPDRTVDERKRRAMAELIQDAFRAYTKGQILPEGSIVLYTDKRESPWKEVEVEVVKVHYDRTVPYYEIRLSDDRSIVTDRKSLSRKAATPPATAAALAPSEPKPEPESPVSTEEVSEDEILTTPIFSTELLLAYEKVPTFLVTPSPLPEPPIEAASKRESTREYFRNVFIAIARTMDANLRGGGDATSRGNKAARLAFGAIGMAMAGIAIAELRRRLTQTEEVPEPVSGGRFLDFLVSQVFPVEASQTDARVADARMAPEGRRHTLFDASQPHIQNTQSVGAIPGTLPTDLTDELSSDITRRSAATGALRGAGINHLYMARSADDWPTLQTSTPSTPSTPPEPPLADFGWGHSFSDMDPELLDVDVLRRTLVRAKRAFEDKATASNSVRLVQSYIDNMDRRKDSCDDDGGDEMAPFHNRRKVLWDDALREAAISNDRLYAFVRQLTGTLSEAVDAVAVIDDSSLAEQSRKIVAARERAAKVASDAHVQLVKALVGAVLKDSRLSLDVAGGEAGGEGGSGNGLHVSTTSLRRHAESLRAGATGAAGALTAAIDLDNLLASKEDTVPLADLLERLKVVGVAMQQAAMTSFTNGGSTQMTDVSMDFVAAPRNSMLLRWKPEAKAAVRRAFDLLVGEIKASHAGHLGCGFATRLPTAFELLEGVNDALSNLFAQLTAHVLVASRMSSPAYAPYLQRSTLATNGRQVRIELERCVRAWSEHCERFPRPTFRHDERGHYFGVR